jgi:succinoglycan biosynthesis protein ExoL
MPLYLLPKSTFPRPPILILAFINITFSDKIWPYGNFKCSSRRAPVKPRTGIRHFDRPRIVRMTFRIAYLAHDLSDAAIHRRVRMLARGGATVIPIGFRRGAAAITAVEGVMAVDLGRTSDGMLAKRVGSVIGALAKLRNLEAHIRGANVILARNLEMLVLAIRARRLYAPTAAIVYECLDIHRMLVANRPDGHLLRMLETRLWCDVDLLLTSSPGFVRNYFVPRGFPSPIRLVENKVLEIEGRDGKPVPARRPPAGPPWRIGWFGVIRCRASLDILSSLARAADGAIEVAVRGQPSGATFRDFDVAIRNLPHVRYAGPYRNPADLPAIYGDVHFSWAVDYFETGQNSAWLLPNRIYEGTLHGAVPIALAGVETGRWLAERGIGVLLNEPIKEHAINFFRGLDGEAYSILANRIAALPRTELVDDLANCRELVDALRVPRRHGPSDAGPITRRHPREIHP